VSRRGWLLFAAMCLLWGIPYLLIRVADRTLAPAELVFLRTALGAVILLPYAVARGQLGRVLRRWRPLLGYVVVEIAAPWLMLSDAERRLPSSLSGLLIASVPLIGVLVSRLGPRRDPVDGRELAGLAVGLAGVAALLGFQVTGADAGSAVEVGGVAVGYAIGPVILTRWLADLPAVAVMGAALGVTALGYLPAGLLLLPHHWPGAATVASVAGLGVFCTAAAFVVFFHLVLDAGPVRATVVTYVNPVVAVALGVGLLGEPFTPGTAVGLVLILGGCALATRRRQGPEPTAGPVVGAAAGTVATAVAAPAVEAPDAGRSPTPAAHRWGPTEGPSPCRSSRR
jgi:drug/metabolite transporter (DMT)-like permease